MTSPRCMARDTASVSPAPTACATSGSSAISVPAQKIDTLKKYRLPKRHRREHRRRDASDHERVDDAHRHEAELHEHDRNRERDRRPQLGVPIATFGAMRIWHLVTVAALGRSRATPPRKGVSVLAQAIPVVTRADPTGDAARRSPKAISRSRS